VFVLCFCGLRVARGASDYLIDVWSGDNGLPNSSVSAIAQTPDGYLWIGTHNGLARFDGIRFVNFDPINTPELDQARIRGLFVDEHGTLWINTYGNALTSWRNGVFKSEFQAQQVASIFSRPDGLLFTMQGGDLVLRKKDTNGMATWQSFKPSGRTTGDSYHRDRQGNLWYVTRDGSLGHLNPNGTNGVVLSQVPGLEGQRINYLTSDALERIWVGTDKGIYLWDGQRFQDQTPTNGETRVQVSFLFCSKDGGCWVLGNSKLRKAINRKWVVETESWGPLLGSHNPAFDAHEDRKGDVWFRHFGQGVFHAKVDGTQRQITSADGLPGDRVTCWFEDREGNIWVGVDRGGLVRLREKHFQVLGLAEGPGTSGAVSVCEDAEGAMWIGTYGGGLNRWQGGRFHVFTLPEGPTKGFFFSAYPDPREGRLWLSAGREDFYQFEAGNISVSPWPAHGIKVLLVDRKERIWIGRKSGLACLSDGVLENLAANVEATDIHALAEDKQGSIWAGGENGVLYQFKDGKFIAHRPDGNLGRQTIWSLLPDEDGTIWVGTFRGGLLRFKEGKFTRYTVEDGLPSDIICQILDDGAGKIWIGSHHGIFHVAKSALNAFAQGEQSSVPCFSYGLYDGLPTLECSGSYQPSAWRAHDGRLWFATFKGVVSIQPGDLPKNELPPPVVIEELRVDGKSTELKLPGEEATGRRHGELRIPPGRHYFEIRYTALSFVSPDKIRFQHKLEGLENEWTRTGARREVNYSHLAPGNYRFRVIARNSDGVWNEQGAALAFTVLPYFWQTWWFKSVSVAAILGTIFGSVRFMATRNLRRKLERLKQQRAIERDRERIAKDIHDDLGAGLTQIMLQSAMARNDSQDEMKVHLTQISETARELVRDMDETVWAINPENDTLDGVVTYIGKFVQEYVTAARLRCRLELPAQLPVIPVAAEVRHNLFLAVKEALNNIIKHADASEVFFQLTLDSSAFMLVIRDNGRGFSSDTVPVNPVEGRISSGLGLQNLADRMEQIGGRCTITSRPGSGTEIQLTVVIQVSGDR
jgi:signal transduction histidine kinase/ligand-binding sensor domain-containing protein